MFLILIQDICLQNSDWQSLAFEQPISEDADIIQKSKNMNC